MSPICGYLHFLETNILGGDIVSPLGKLRIKLLPVPCASLVFHTGPILLVFLVVITIIGCTYVKNKWVLSTFFFPLALC